MSQYNVRVIIEDMRRIPTIGKGPIRNPIYITNEVYNLLKLLGYNVIKVEEEKVKKIVVESTEELTKEEVVVEETAESETVEEVTEDIEESLEIETVEEIAEENIEEDIEVTEEETIEELDVDSMVKKDLKAELDARNISYAYNATVETLRNILKENL